MYRKTVLDNGLRVITSTVPHARSVSVCFFIGAGSRHELAEQAGLSHFVEHLVFKGTERRPTAKELSETIDGVGGLLNGGTDKEFTVYWAKVARPHLLLALDLLVDMLRCSKYDGMDMENERKVIIEELNMCMDSPQSRVDTLIDEVLWPNQALGRDVAGTKETVAQIDRQMILDYVLSRYVANNAVVTVAGDIDHDEVTGVVNDALRSWGGGVPAECDPVQDSQDEPRLMVEPRKTEQAHMCLAVRGLSSTHADRFVLDLLNVVLGEGMSSRLFLEIREKRGLTYDIHSHVSHFRDSGAVTIYAGVEPKKLEDTMEAILAELSKLRDSGAPEAEVSKARELAKGRLVLRMEDTRSVASWIGGQELITGRIRTVDEVLGIVDSITADDLQRVANDLFITGNLNVAVVGRLPNRTRLERLLSL